MSTEKQRIAIAEACGIYKQAHSGFFVGENWTGCTPPDYLNDPAAMREALMALPTDQKRAFARELAKLIGWRPETDYELFEFATATDRWPEAFLKTIGKWEEES